MIKAKSILLKTCVILCSIMMLACSACTDNSNNGHELFLSDESITISINEQAQLHIVSLIDSDVLWSSSNEAVASVSNDGTVVGKSFGEAVIKATFGSKFALCEVFVTNDALPTGGYIKVWADEFDGDTLDREKWNYQTGTKDYYGSSQGPNYWGNNEQQYYTEKAAQVEDGMLTITAKKEKLGDRDYTSARIVTRDLSYWEFGYFEARIKLPAIRGMWPAFWMLPQPSSLESSHNEYGGWAANGEIDIMEAKGRLPNEASQALHFGGYWPENEYKANTTALNSSIATWHTYGLEWTKEFISWHLDGEVVFTLSKSDWWSVASESESAPFDVPFFILINLAVGGTFDGGVMPNQNFESAQMCVDYVRVYQNQ